MKIFVVSKVGEQIYLSGIIYTYSIENLGILHRYKVSQSFVCVRARKVWKLEPIQMCGPIIGLRSILENISFNSTPVNKVGC